MSDFKVLMLFLYCVEFLPSLSRCLSIVAPASGELFCCKPLRRCLILHADKHVYNMGRVCCLGLEIGCGERKSNLWF